MRKKFGLAGAPGHDVPEVDGGAAYVFWHDGVDWSEQAKIPDPLPNDQLRFGTSVSISGEVAGIGRFEAYPGWIFRRNGAVWSQEGIMFPSEEFAFSDLPRSLAIRGNVGVIAALPNPIGPIPPPDDLGSATVFRYDGASWAEEAILAGCRT